MIRNTLYTEDLSYVLRMYCCDTKVEQKFRSLIIGPRHTITRSRIVALIKADLVRIFVLR